MLSINAPLSALSSFGVDVQVTANNIANVNTHGYRATRVEYETEPYDAGVRVGAFLRDPAPGATFYYPSESGAVPIESSTVNLVREFSNLVTVQNAYSSNAANLQVQDRLTGVLVDMIS